MTRTPVKIRTTECNTTRTTSEMDKLVEVEGGCFVSGIGASENIYRLAKQHATWKAVKDEVTGVS